MAWGNCACGGSSDGKTQQVGGGVFAPPSVPPAARRHSRGGGLSICYEKVCLNVNAKTMTPTCPERHAGEPQPGQPLDWQAAETMMRLWPDRLTAKNQIIFLPGRSKLRHGWSGLARQRRLPWAEALQLQKIWQACLSNPRATGRVFIPYKIKKRNKNMPCWLGVFFVLQGWSEFL